MERKIKGAHKIYAYSAVDEPTSPSNHYLK